jgi:hypothetical protein
MGSTSERRYASLVGHDADLSTDTRWPLLGERVDELAGYALGTSGG